MESSGPSNRSAGRLVPFLRRYPLFGFFLLAYSVTWLEEFVLLTLLGLPSALVISLAPVGPTCAAVIVICLIDGRPGLRRLLRRMTLWRVGTQWYLIALLGIPLVYLLATLVLPGSLASFRPMAPLRWVGEYLVVFVAGGIIGGPLFEEPGWRGFALPRLQANLGPLGGTLLLGGLWSLWHLPQYFVPDWANANGGLHPSSIAVFILTVMAITTILTWVFNHTQGSLLLAMLVHSSVNASQVGLNELFPSAAGTELNALLGFGGVALVLILLTRGRLGYRGGKVGLPSVITRR
jgi:membrane protease YdiL (CAAX protease family)